MFLLITKIEIFSNRKGVNGDYFKGHCDKDINSPIKKNLISTGSHTWNIWNSFQS